MRRLIEKVVKENPWATHVANTPFNDVEWRPCIKNDEGQYTTKNGGVFNCSLFEFSDITAIKEKQAVKLELLLQAVQSIKVYNVAATNTVLLASKLCRDRQIGKEPFRSLSYRDSLKTALEIAQLVEGTFHAFVTQSIDNMDRDCKALVVPLHEISHYSRRIKEREPSFPLWFCVWIAEEVNDHANRIDSMFVTFKSGEPAYNAAILGDCRYRPRKGWVDYDT